MRTQGFFFERLLRPLAPDQRRAMAYEGCMTILAVFIVAVPLMALVSYLAGIIAFVLIALWSGLYRRAHSHCPHCGYRLGVFEPSRDLLFLGICDRCLKPYPGKPPLHVRLWHKLRAR